MWRDASARSFERQRARVAPVAVARAARQAVWRGRRSPSPARTPRLATPRSDRSASCSTTAPEQYTRRAPAARARKQRSTSSPTWRYASSKPPTRSNASRRQPRFALTDQPAATFAPAGSAMRPRTLGGAGFDEVRIRTSPPARSAPGVQTVRQRFEPAGMRDAAGVEEGDERGVGGGHAGVAGAGAGRARLGDHPRAVRGGRPRPSSRARRCRPRRRPAPGEATRASREASRRGVPGRDDDGDGLRVGPLGGRAGRLGRLGHRGLVPHDRPPGPWPHPRLLRHPRRAESPSRERLDGKRCLDVGTYDGFWAFEIEQRGAKEVVAVDVLDPRRWDWPS